MSEIHTTLAALVTGLATSFHCVGMCGPIACGLGNLAKTESQRLVSATLYHGMRLTSYASIGAICGAIGQQPLKWYFGSPAVMLPWIMIVVLLMMGLGLDKQVPRPAFLNRFTARVRFKVGRYSAYGAAMAMGLLTPILPCGPLYMIFGSSLLAGSAARGAEFTLAFGLGTVPLLWLAQQQFHRIQARLTPTAMNRLRRGLAIATALLLAWRLQSTIPATWYGNPTPPQPAANELPTCPHCKPTPP
ncbi:MAG: sulfite exporter TauE/SafE family protein [Verrucomicrobia bacterium]|nr:MAG: sulfite exporter TauE/SafE family protein [Verrucomicrobiota bacterium]